MLVVILLLSLVSPATSEYITTGCQGKQKQIEVRDDRGQIKRLRKSGHIIDRSSNNDPGSWPWAVSIGKRDQGKWMHECDGVIITGTHIITSASCIDNYEFLTGPVTQLSVIAGDNRLKINVEKTVQERPVKDNSKHPKYHPHFGIQRYYYDIAVITLSAQLDFNEFVHPAFIPTLEEAKLTSKAVDTGVSLTICGWGGTYVSDRGDTLEDAVVTSLSNSYCATVSDQEDKDRLKSGWTDSVMCAVNILDLSGTCSNGAGSGLFRLDDSSNRYILTGILAKNFATDDENKPTCGSPDKPNIFIRVASSKIINFLYKTIYDVDTDCPRYQYQLQDDISVSPVDLDDYYTKCGVNNVIDKQFNLNMNAPKDLEGRWPWLVAIYINFDDGRDIFEFQCGATILTTTKLLTAAHCFDKKDTHKIKAMKVRAGDVALNSMVHFLETDITKHNEYKGGRYFDLAIIDLKTPLPLTNHIQPVCLMSLEEASRTQKLNEKSLSLAVSGWGKTLPDKNKGLAGVELNNIVASVFSKETCDKEYIERDGKAINTLPDGFTPEVLCAGDPAGDSGTCKGDSGGGAVTFDEHKKRFVLRGVVSGSLHGDCGTDIAPNVYARLSSTSILKWIYGQISFVAPTAIELTKDQAGGYTCKAEANPAAQIILTLTYVDGQDQVETSTSSIKKIMPKSELKRGYGLIPIVKLKALAKITCIAENLVGHQTTIICVNSRKEEDVCTSGQTCSAEGQCQDVGVVVDGGYTDWGQFSLCSKTCGDGTKTRMRTCTNPSPQPNGRTCLEQNLGKPTDTQPCNLGACEDQVAFVVGGFAYSRIPVASEERVGYSTEVLEYLPSSCTKPTAEISISRYGHTINYVGDVMIMCGGYSDTYRSCVSSNGPNGPWLPHSDTKASRCYHDSVFDGNHLHLIGGADSGTTMETLQGNEWTLHDMPYTVGASSCSVQTGPGEFIITGGSGSSRSVYKWREGTWTQLDDMNGGRDSHGCAAITINDVVHVVVAGGNYPGMNALRSSELYNVQTGKWINIGQLEHGRLGGVMVGVRIQEMTKVMMLGGSNEISYLNSVEELVINEANIAQTTWKLKESVQMKKARRAFAAVAVSKSMACS